MTEMIGAFITLFWIIAILAVGVAGTVYLYQYIRKQNQENKVRRLQRMRGYKNVAFDHQAQARAHIAHNKATHVRN